METFCRQRRVLDRKTDVVFESHRIYARSDMFLAIRRVRLRVQAPPETRKLRMVTHNI